MCQRYSAKYCRCRAIGAHTCQKAWTTTFSIIQYYACMLFEHAANRQLKIAVAALCTYNARCQSERTCACLEGVYDLLALTDVGRQTQTRQRRKKKNQCRLHAVFSISRTCAGLQCRAPYYSRWRNNEEYQSFCIRIYQSNCRRHSISRRYLV